jgi:hypothetical protein
MTTTAADFPNIKVRTTYRGPSDYHGSQIRVSDGSGSRVTGYDFSRGGILNPEDGHRAAVETIYPGAEITLIADHARGYFYNVKPS